MRASTTVCRTQCLTLFAGQVGCPSSLTATLRHCPSLLCAVSCRRHHALTLLLRGGVACADKEVTLYHKQFNEIEQYALKRVGRAVTVKMGDKVSLVLKKHQSMHSHRLAQTRTLICDPLECPTALACSLFVFVFGFVG